MPSIQKSPRARSTADSGRLPPGLIEKVERTLLEHYAPPCLAVDSEHVILHSFGPVDHYFDAQPLTPFRKLFDVAPRDLVGPLRGLFARIVAEGGRTVRQTVFVGESGARRPIELSVQSLRHDGGSGGPFLLVIEDRELSRSAGRGTQTVTSPSSAAPESPGAIETTGEDTGRAGRILVIEDHIDAAEGMRLLLELKGYRVTVAHDGQAGIDKARQFQPGIVLCDIGLPGSMDGYAVARLFRSDPQLSSSTLVALTGYAQEKDQTLAVEAGFDAHMTKPADPAALIRLLETMPRRT